MEVCLKGFFTIQNEYIAMTIMNSSTGNQHETERHPMMQPVELSIAGRVITGDLFDLSKVSAKVRLNLADAIELAMMKGDEATLTIALFSDIPCSVVWVDDNYVGLELDESDVVLSMIEVECLRGVNRIAV